ncbi:MAG: hypothetical protein NT062_22570 [Proteobacteria bacterium]|nr:hypothetical protein [Pseudomonadota bacterium]
MFAEDRRDLLEQALAILQPNLQIGIAELVGPLDVLRTELTSLEDAQEELYDWEKAGLAEHAPPGDKPPDDGTTPVPTGPAEDTSLDGPERVIAKPGSTLDGEPLPDEPPAASTLSDEPAPTPGKPAGRGGRRG